MPYEIEDEVDWSDSSLHDTSSKHQDPSINPTIVSPVDVNNEYDYLFDPDMIEDYITLEEYQNPSGVPLVPDSSNSDNLYPAPSRVDDLRIEDRFNCRLPSKDDYANFGLYQANQKAYEATRLKQFIAHALHPAQMGRCFDGKNDAHVEVDRYMASVACTVNQITNGMVWNAHHRIINMLVNDGRDSAPFLDLNALDDTIFADFGPDSNSPAIRQINDSWHHTNPSPLMVQVFATDYPLSPHSHPLEDVDDVTNTLFHVFSPDTILPAGQAAARKVGEKQIISDRTDQEKQNLMSRNDRPLSCPRTPEPDEALPTIETARLVQLLDRCVHHHNGQMDKHENFSLTDEFSLACLNDAPTQLEMLFERHGSNALASNHAEPRTASEDNIATENALYWPQRLLADHKQRLALRWGYTSQARQTPLPNFKDVLAKAIEKGFRPTSFELFGEADTGISSEKYRDLKHHVPECIPLPEGISSAESSSRPPQKRRKATEVRSSVHNSASYKRLRTNAKGHVSQAFTDDTPLPPHPSGSKTLEPDQILPSHAYFEPRLPDEKPAWRCSIKHAMGHYYNAGDRKACRGCNTSLMDIPKVKYMDFYLPRKSIFYQPAPSVRWKPSRPSGKGRKSNRPCHNSIAKDAYWAAVGDGAPENEARTIACNAVTEFLRPKSCKESTPVAKAESTIDLGPHPSGSKTMEHGQDLPEMAYTDKQNRHEEFAWRCDVSHALGRYYLAGDKRSCPGCGTNKGGLGRQTIMDFYMPPGMILRQEAPGLVKWKPRRYKSRTSGNTNGGKNAGKKEKAKSLSHNQICAEKYFDLEAEGYDGDETLRVAVEQTDIYLVEKQEDSARMYEHDEYEDEAASRNVGEKLSTGSTRRSRGDSVASSQSGSLHTGTYRHNSRGGCTVSLIPTKRTSDNLSDDESDSLFVGAYRGEQEGRELLRDHDLLEHQSFDEESSSSDSE